MNNIYYPEIYNFNIFGINCKIVDESNINLLLFYRNKDYIREVVGDSRPVTLEVLIFWLKKVYQSNNNLPYIVYIKDNPVAYMELKNINYNKNIYEVGIFLFDKKYFGTGLAERIALSWEFICFKKNISTYYSKILKNNIRSINFFKKIGGVYLRQDDIFFVLEHNFENRIKSLKLVASRLGLLDEYKSLMT